REVFRLLVKGGGDLGDAVRLVGAVPDGDGAFVPMGAVFVVQELIVGWVGGLFVGVLVPIGTALQIVGIGLGAIQGVVQAHPTIRVGEGQGEGTVVEPRRVGKLGGCQGLGLEHS